MASRKPGYKSQPHYKNELNAQKKPKEVKKRVARNKARRQAIEKGVARVGDGKDVHHRVSMIQGVKKAESGGVTLMDAGSNRGEKPKGMSKTGPKPKKRKKKNG